MRRQINKVLKPFGYEIIKLSKFFETIKNIQKKNRNFTFIQIGANDGVQFDSLYQFVTTNKCKGIVIEPLPDFYGKLAHNYRDFPTIIPLQIAVHSSKKKSIIYRVDPEKLHMLPAWAEGISSFNPDHHKKSNTPSNFIIKEEVECMHLMDIIIDFGFECLDLLQIDTEGYDAEVIKMIDFTKVSPNVIKYEHSNLTQKEGNEVKTLLKKNGYRIFIERHDTIAIKK